MVVVQTRNDGNVTNAEARSMLNERRLSRQASAYMRKLVRCHGSELAQANINNDKRLREADEIMELALDYLNKQAAAFQTADNIGQCLKAMRGANGTTDFKLRPDERIQIINLAPADPVIIHAICQDCDRRYSDEEVEDILRLSRDYLQRPHKATNTNGHSGE